MSNIKENYHNLPIPPRNKTGWENPRTDLYYNKNQNLDSLLGTNCSGTRNTKLINLEKSRNPQFTYEGVINNTNYVSKNQKLLGKANPKTLIAPVITPPLVDLEFWKTNNLVTYPQINEESNQDLYHSGYQVSTCCPPALNKYMLSVPSTEPNWAQKEVLENIEHENKFKILREDYGNSSVGGVREDYKLPLKLQKIDIPVGDLKSKKGGIDFEYPYIKIPTGVTAVIPGGSGQVNAGCGYNPKQIFEADLPSNLPVGIAQKDPRMREYNKNLFTQTIQPGVYTQSQVNEPINSNIGISFTQQFEPVTSRVEPISGEIKYTEHDPRVIDTDIFSKKPPPVEIQATEANIYDPRFTGYGTSYRAYHDDNVGQPRFYYDDVNAIRMPNYVTRSNIDREKFADHYGPIPEGNEFGNQNHSEIRALANNSFMEATLTFRNELQERLSRKSNARKWQQRMAPIRTGGQSMLGGNMRIV